MTDLLASIYRMQHKKRG